MTHVVCEPCIKCKFTECVAVCPVDCFREGANMLAIDPDECIDCGACIDECPVSAIYPEEDLPEEWAEYLELNAKYAAAWPVISETTEPMPEADAYQDVANKRELFDPNPGPGDA
jgi:ferredoxin